MKRSMIKFAATESNWGKAPAGRGAALDDQTEDHAN